MGSRQPTPLRGLSLLVIAVSYAGISTAVFAPNVALRAQAPAVKLDVRAARGLVVSPVYEGWYRLGDTTYALFGYYNRNLEEVVDVPIGSDNKVEPGPIEQTQPTRFFPGRHYGVFATAVPKDRPGTEVTWTLSGRGQTLSIPAFFDQLYFVFPQREDGGPHPGNTPPMLRFEASGPSAQGPLGTTTRRTATVLRPLAIDVWVTDDGLPPPPRGPAVAPSAGSTLSPRPRGLTVAWRLYRGPSDVSFSSATPALERGKAHTLVTFREPGEYMLHVLAMDSRSGSMCCWTNGYVKVAVEGEKAAGISNGGKP